MLDHEDFVLAALEQEGRIDRAVLDAARRAARERGVSVCEALTESGAINARELAIVRAETCEVSFVDLGHYEIDLKNTTLLPRSSAEALLAFPLFVLGSVATVGMANPLDLRAVDQLRSLLHKDIEPVLCEARALRGLIDRAYAIAGDPAAARAEAAGVAGDSSLTTGKEPIVAAVNQILAQAADRHASDIHINPDEGTLHLRYRIDGLLQPQQGPGLASHDAIVRRLKVMANLDLTQSRRPQDGKFRFVHGGQPIDVRLSIIPTVCGENAVMRLLTSNASLRGLHELGIGQADCQEIERCIAMPHGMVLVCGPTGSGKTTTVYTALKKLNVAERNIMTIEDPVEIRLPLIRQVQANHEIGLGFAGALRAILRQDPDVVFVGEIRDDETARIATQAALTGHMVLSTVHTNDAAGALPRLRDLGCPGFAINASLLCVVAQRLVRKVCESCAEPTRAEEPWASMFGIDRAHDGFVRGAGCGRCGHSGYKGRIGVYEVLRPTNDVGRAVERGGDAQEVRSAAIRGGMRPMWRDGLEKARLGLTTLEEVARVVAVQVTDLEPATPPVPPLDSGGGEHGGVGAGAMRLSA